METAIIVALITSAASLITSGAVAVWVAHRRGAIDIKIAQMQADLQRELAEQKTKTENRIQNAAENVARGLFNEFPRKTRSFIVFQRRLKSFSDDDLRRLLIGMGAHAVRMPGGAEGWQLVEEDQGD
jgi:hypothetical protein